ncbi:hypothetical protein ACOSQ3_013014 [Xanthoceras sorbifolium]
MGDHISVGWSSSSCTPPISSPVLLFPLLCLVSSLLKLRAGYTVQAERLNYLRFLSFFRAVHRGASFAGLRTTSVRKLLPESWGFLCPVHTPDGEPCELLNHMTSNCRKFIHVYLLFQNV